MDNQYNPKPKQFNTQDIPKAKEVFYSNGMNMDVNPNELVLTFDQMLPGSESKAITIVMNANAIYQLKDAFNSMVKVHDEKLEEIKRNDRKDD